MSSAAAHMWFTIYSNGSIIPTGFKFTELHALTLAARSYVLLHLDKILLRSEAYFGVKGAEESRGNGMESGKTEDWYRNQVGVTWESDIGIRCG